MEKKTIGVTLGLNCDEVNIKLNKLEKQLDRIIEKQELIRTMKRDKDLYKLWFDMTQLLIPWNHIQPIQPAQPKHNNITINMNRSIDSDAVAEHIAKSIKLALGNM